MECHGSPGWPLLIAGGQIPYPHSRLTTAHPAKAGLAKPRILASSVLPSLRHEGPQDRGGHIGTSAILFQSEKAEEHEFIHTLGTVTSRQGCTGLSLFRLAVEHQFRRVKGYAHLTLLACGASRMRSQRCAGHL